MPDPLVVDADIATFMAATTEAEMRTALGLGTASVEAASAFATADQGATADSALQAVPANLTWDDSGFSGNLANGDDTLQEIFDKLDALSGGGGGGDVVDDTTPQLGGDLDVNGNDITSSSAGNINIIPDSTGKVVIGPDISYVYECDMNAQLNCNYGVNVDGGTLGGFTAAFHSASVKTRQFLFNRTEIGTLHTDGTYFSVGSAGEFTILNQEAGVNAHIIIRASGGHFSMWSGGSEALRLETNQAATFSGRIVASASTTARASLNVPSGTAPTSPANGDIWSDGTDILVRLGGTTYTLTKT